MFKIRCPAKLNTFINVLKRRDDGYHEIYSNLQLIDLYDEISFKRSDRTRIISDEKSLVSNNLIENAIQWFNKNFSVNQCYEVTLKKLIPHGAGLGGGSSNAAHTIIFLCIINKIPVDELNTHAISKEIGADVPFFIHGKSADVFGIGEKIEKDCFKGDDYLLIHPNIHISTKDIFKSHHLKLKTSIDRESNDLLAPLMQESTEFNDFFVKISSVLKGSEHRLKLTGSGSCLYIANPTKMEKEILSQKIGDNFRIFFVKGLEYYDFVSDWGVAKW